MRTRCSLTEHLIKTQTQSTDVGNTEEERKEEFPMLLSGRKCAPNFFGFDDIRVLAEPGVLSLKDLSDTTSSIFTYKAKRPGYTSSQYQGCHNKYI